MRKVILPACLILLLVMGGGCNGQSSAPVQEYQRQSMVMDTLISIQVWASDSASGKSALDAAFAEFIRIDHLCDRFALKKLSDPNVSDVYRININAGIKPTVVSDDVLAMLKQSQRMAYLSKGAFDVTVGPLMDCWGFTTKQYRVPADTELKAALSLVDYRQVVVDEQKKTVFLPRKGMEIDLGGVAKGYATDRAAQKLREMGIKSALINAGGNIYALGAKPDGSAWSTGIQDPRNPNQIIAIIKVKNQAVVSSGDYERYFIRDGIRYHHILDPATGKPARQLIATTIVGPSATEADLLSTTLFVTGSQTGTALVGQLANVNAVFVDEAKNIRTTPGLVDRIEVIKESGYHLK